MIPKIHLVNDYDYDYESPLAPGLMPPATYSESSWQRIRHQIILLVNKHDEG